ncbi:uncharacterized protein [Apostichopus japonicus]|uniref:uncharacterized protein n=1 Tax=Stichopus japonicus TaxID=307972 RepID=UPI003AB573FE
MKSLHFEVESQKPCLIGLHIPHKSKLIKRVRVVPIVNRITNLGDDLIIRLWIHNDHELEHQSLINEEIYHRKGIQLHHPVSVQLKSMDSSLPFSITSSSSRCSPYPRKVEVALSTLWLRNRHKVVFHLQNKGMKDTVNLEIDARYATTNKVLFQINIELKIGNLLRKDQATSPFQRVLPETMQRAFSHLKHNLSQDLNADQCTQLATIFHLHDEAISNIQKHRTPGRLLLDKLTQTSMISPANISTLENFLTEQGIEECARHVRDYRKNNPIVDAIMCPEVGFS